MEKLATSWGFIEKSGVNWSDCVAASWSAGSGWIGRWQDGGNWHIGRMWITFNTLVTEEEWTAPYANAQAYVTLPAIDWLWEAAYYYTLNLSGYSDLNASLGASIGSGGMTTCLDGAAYSGDNAYFHSHTFFSSFNTEGYTYLFIADDYETTYPYYPNQAKAVKIDGTVTPTMIIELGEPMVSIQFFRFKLEGGVGTASVGTHTVNAGKTRNKYGRTS